MPRAVLGRGQWEGWGTCRLHTLASSEALPQPVAHPPPTAVSRGVERVGNHDKFDYFPSVRSGTRAVHSLRTPDRARETHQAAGRLRGS